MKLEKRKEKQSISRYSQNTAGCDPLSRWGCLAFQSDSPLRIFKWVLHALAPKIWLFLYLVFVFFFFFLRVIVSDKKIYCVLISRFFWSSCRVKSDDPNHFIDLICTLHVLFSNVCNFFVLLDFDKKISLVFQMAPTVFIL